MTSPKWGRRLHRVIRDLPEELATYKGFIDNRPMMLKHKDFVFDFFFSYFIRIDQHKHSAQSFPGYLESLRI
jgi:hypothetical protein